MDLATTRVTEFSTATLLTTDDPSRPGDFKMVVRCSRKTESGGKENDSFVWEIRHLTGDAYVLAMVGDHFPTRMMFGTLSESLDRVACLVRDSIEQYESPMYKTAVVAGV